MTKRCSGSGSRKSPFETIRRYIVTAAEVNTGEVKLLKLILRQEEEAARKHMQLNLTTSSKINADQMLAKRFNNKKGSKYSQDQTFGGLLDLKKMRGAIKKMNEKDDEKRGEKRRMNLFMRSSEEEVQRKGRETGCTFWDTQQDWKLISWKLHSSSGVHTIMTSTGLVFHMLVESKYPLTKEVLSQMLELKLETEEESSMALELITVVRIQLGRI
ncbi:hypothetical protein Tco_0133473 [Tanacetum coccineum]